MRKIIVGVDLSSESELAVGHAVGLGRRQGAEVVLALAGYIPNRPDGAPPPPDAYINVVTERLVADRRDLAALRERWLGHGVEISQILADGYPDDQIPKVATELGADLIVVGTHGRTGIKRFLIGSVAERIVRLAGCSVLVARGSAPIGGYRRIVVGTDFSPQAEASVCKAIEMAAPGATIDVVNCWQVTPWFTPLDVGAPVAAKLRTDLVAQLGGEGAALLAKLRARTDVRTDVELRFHAVEKPAAVGLDEVARDLGADLIVVGSHGRRGVRRFVLGSVAEVTVRHAPCAVLVAR